MHSQFWFHFDYFSLFGNLCHFDLEVIRRLIALFYRNLCHYLAVLAHRLNLELAQDKRHYSIKYYYYYLLTYVQIIVLTTTTDI